MAEQPHDMIVIKNLYKWFGALCAVNNVSMTVPTGKVLVVIGPSGSGKSTVLRCINHLETPSGGEVWVDGIKLTHSHKSINIIRAEVGMVFQQFNLFPHLTALDNIVLAQRVVRKRKEDEARRVAIQQTDRPTVTQPAPAQAPRPGVQLPPAPAAQPPRVEAEGGAMNSNISASVAA